MANLLYRRYVFPRPSARTMIPKSHDLPLSPDRFDRSWTSKSLAWMPRALKERKPLRCRTVYGHAKCFVMIP